MKVEVVVGSGRKVEPDSVRSLVEAVLSAEGASGSVVVAFVDEQQMIGLNGRFRGMEGPTDVLSFRQADAESGWPEIDERGEAELGEVVVCPEVVSRYAREADGDREDLLGRTVLHGVLHLLGYDHEQDQGEMRAREEALAQELRPKISAISLEMEG